MTRIATMLVCITVLLMGCSNDGTIDTSNPVNPQTTDPTTTPTVPDVDGSTTVPDTDTDLPIDDANQPEEGEGEQEPEPTPEEVFNQLNDNGGLVPEFRWSLVAVDPGTGEINVEEDNPDPNWFSNSFTVESLLSPDNKLAAMIDCVEYRFTVVPLSENTFQLGIGEPFPPTLECIVNVPPPPPIPCPPGSFFGGCDQTPPYVRGVFADLANIVVEPDGNQRLQVTGSNGTKLFYKAKGLND